VCEKGRLVEAAKAQASGMEGHGDTDIWERQSYFAYTVSQPHSERFGEPRNEAVF
jgi:hypothetical protein